MSTKTNEANLLAKINLVTALPEVRQGLLSECKIALDDLRQENARHSEELARIESRFQHEVWSAVLASWAKEEIAAAAAIINRNMY